MRSLLLVLSLAACGTRSTGRADAQIPKAPPEVGVKNAVHEFFASVDGRDAIKFKASTTSRFTLFEEGVATSAKAMIGHWESATKPTRTRSCKDETLRRSGSVFVYTGDCTETAPAIEHAQGERWQGWNTVVLAPKGNAWAVAFWQWQPSGITGQRIRWNDAYRRGNFFSKEPTPFLIKSLQDAKPGRALVLAMGQGRNALYLASNNWQVTGLDISEIGIAEAKATAAEGGLSLDAVLADINEYPFGEERWDLVTMLYAGGDVDWIKRAQVALAPSGTFVLEHFYSAAADDNWSISLSPKELETLFAGWEILENQVVEDLAEWGKTKAPLLRFAARTRAAPGPQSTRTDGRAGAHCSQAAGRLGLCSIGGPGFGASRSRARSRSCS